MTTKTGAELIAAERERQQFAEGYDAGHDDEHSKMELTRAAIQYASAAVNVYRTQVQLPGVRRVVEIRGGDPDTDPWVRQMVEDPIGHAYGRNDDDGTARPLEGWPWRDEDWKPSNDRVANLVKAGALIAAEIDRLQRSAEEAH